VRQVLREQGYREDLVQRMKYSPVADDAAELARGPGAYKIEGHTDDATRGVASRGGEVHSAALDHWQKPSRNAGQIVLEGKWVDRPPESVATVVRHEADHLLKSDQLVPQAARGGPAEHFFDAGGKLNREGLGFMEREAHLADLDQNLRKRQFAEDMVRREPQHAEVWRERVRAADVLVDKARANLQVYMDHPAFKATKEPR
jgi:hypothetical protein